MNTFDLTLVRIVINLIGARRTLERLGRGRDLHFRPGAMFALSICLGVSGKITG